MKQGKWFTPLLAIAFSSFLAVGLWAYAISGAYNLIVIGTLGLGLVAIAERQRRAFAATKSTG
jgi:uncharacterized membrane protein